MSYNVYTTLAPQQRSRCFLSGLQRVSQIPRQLSACLLSGISSACMGECGQATLDLWQLSVCLQHRWWCPEPTQVGGHLSFCNRDGTTSSRISNQWWKENCSKLLLWHTQMAPLTWWVKLQKRLSRPVSGNLSEWQWPRELLRVQMYHRSQMMMLFRGVRKLRDPTRWQKDLHNVYFSKVAPDGKD